mgnify:CR=1 FL=1
MKTKRTFLLLLLCCAAQFFTASAQTVLLAGDYPDPTVIKDGDDYYMTHSPLYCQPGFLIWHSRDLFNWEPICRVVDEWRGSAWAPELQKVDDTYYIYFPSDDTNWVTTAKNIRGPWTKPIDLKIGGIDPGLVISPEGIFHKSKLSDERKSMLSRSNAVDRNFTPQWLQCSMSWRWSLCDNSSCCNIFSCESSPSVLAFWYSAFVAWRDTSFSDLNVWNFT